MRPVDEGAEGRGEVADDPPKSPETLAGVRVLEHARIRRAERPRRQHHRDRRAAAARDVAAALVAPDMLEELEQPVGIERRDAACTRGRPAPRPCARRRNATRSVLRRARTRRRDRAASAPPRARQSSRGAEAHQQRHDRHVRQAAAGETAAASRANARGRAPRQRLHDGSPSDLGAACWSTRAGPSGESKPPSGQSATPSKAQKCDGPTEHAPRRRSGARRLVGVRRRRGPENISPACGAIDRADAPRVGTVRRPSR